MEYAVGMRMNWYAFSSWNAVSQVEQLRVYLSFRKCALITIQTHHQTIQCYLPSKCRVSERRVHLLDFKSGRWAKNSRFTSLSLWLLVWNIRLVPPCLLINKVLQARILYNRALWRGGCVYLLTLAPLSESWFGRVSILTISVKLQNPHYDLRHAVMVYMSSKKEEEEEIGDRVVSCIARNKQDIGCTQYARNDSFSPCRFRSSASAVGL